MIRHRHLADRLSFIGLTAISLSLFLVDCRIKSTGTLTHLKASFGLALELSRSPRPRVFRQQSPNLQTSANKCNQHGTHMDPACPRQEGLFFPLSLPSSSSSLTLLSGQGSRRRGGGRRGEEVRRAAGDAAATATAAPRRRSRSRGAVAACSAGAAAGRRGGGSASSSDGKGMCPPPPSE